MITTSLRRATAAGRQIYVRPGPSTVHHARNNLRAFYEQAATRPQPKGYIPIENDAQLVGCLGWTELKGSKVNQRLRGVPQEHKVADETYPAIVYQFVADAGVPDLDTIDAQANLFHLTGFQLVNFTETNWRGKGVLVDFSDIIPHHVGHPWWRERYYSRQGTGYYRGVAEYAIQKGLLGSPPKPVQEPPRPPISQYKRTTDPRLFPKGPPLPPGTVISSPLSACNQKDSPVSATEPPPDSEEGADDNQEEADDNEGLGLQEQEEEAPNPPAL